MVDATSQVEIARSRAEVAETTYTWEDAHSGATVMTLRNRGQPVGFAKIAAPMMVRAITRANRKDLKRLKEILERQ